MGSVQVFPVNAKVAAIVDFPISISKRELCRVLGMVGYYLGFYKNFSSVVVPLTDLLSNPRVFSWTSKL